MLISCVVVLVVLDDFSVLDCRLLKVLVLVVFIIVELELLLVV